MGLLDSIFGKQEVKKGLSRDDFEKSSRAGNAPMMLGTTNRNGLLTPLKDAREYIAMATNSWMLGTAIDKLVDETTKNGGNFVPKNPEMDGSPDMGQLKNIMTFIEKPNVNEDGTVEYTWKDINRGMAFYLLTATYWDIEIIKDPLGRPAEIYPLMSEYVFEADENRRKENFCPRCYRPDAAYMDTTICPSCNMPMESTYWVQVDNARKIVARWAVGGIIRGKTRNFGGRGFGLSKLQRIWTLCQILRWMEQYQYEAYANNRMADKVLGFPEMTQREVNDMFAEVSQIKASNPARTHTLALGSKAPPTVVDLMDSLVDLNAVEMAKFIQQAIAINMGVSLTMVGIDTPGKLGNETEKIDVSMDAVEEIQSEIEEFWNTKFLPMFPEVVDYVWEFESPKGDDLMRKAQILQIQASTVQALRTAGADASLDIGSGKIIVNKWETKDESAQRQAGLFGRRTPEPTEDDEESSKTYTVSFPNTFTTSSPYLVIDKGLAPRHAPSDEGVPKGATKAEKNFVNILDESREKAMKSLEGSPATVFMGLTQVLEEMRSRLVKEAIDWQISYYQSVLSRESATEEWDPSFNQVDMDAIRYMQQDPMGIQSAITRFVGKQREELFAQIQEVYDTPGGLSLDNVRKAISEVIDGTKYELERIGRTETSRITNLARIKRWESIKKDGDAFEFIEATDDRVCEICHAIADGGATEKGSYHGNPYTFDEMTAIAGNEGYAHPNCRCTWVRRPSVFRG